LNTHTHIHTYIHTYAILRNVGTCVPNNTASHPKTLRSQNFFFHRKSCPQASLLDLVEIRFEFRLEHVTCFTWVVLVPPGKYWYSTRALFDLPSRFHSSLRLSRDVRQCSARRYSSWPWVGVHAFYFNALLLVLGFYSPYLYKLLELFFICSQERVRSKRHAVYCTGVKWLVTVVG